MGHAILALIPVGFFVALIIVAVVYSFNPRCCFYEDGEHRCWKPSKWDVERATHIDYYCKRHEPMRLA